jgi:hypothetical protein
VADEKMADVAKLAFAKYQPINGKFQDNFEKIKPCCLKDETFVVIVSVCKPCYCKQLVLLDQRRLE